MGRYNANKTEFLKKMLPQGNIFLTARDNCNILILHPYTP